MEIETSSSAAAGATAPVTGSQDKWAKPEDWDKFRNTITALYLCHSLPNVIRIMRDEHEFHATPKMFQVQIYKKWGLKKSETMPKSNKKRRRNDTDLDDDGSGSRDQHSSMGGDGLQNYDDADETMSQISLPRRHKPPGGSSSGVGIAPASYMHQMAVPPLPISTPAVLPPSTPTPAPVEQDGTLLGALAQTFPDHVTDTPAPQVQVPPPFGWTDFVKAYEGPGPLQLAPGQLSYTTYTNEATAAESVAAQPVPTDHNQIFGDGSPENAGAPGWMTTVLTPGPGSESAAPSESMVTSEQGSRTIPSTLAQVNSLGDTRLTLTSASRTDHDSEHDRHRHRRHHPRSPKSRVSESSSRHTGRSSKSSRTRHSDGSSMTGSSRSGSSRSSAVTLNLPIETLRHLEAPGSLMLPEKSMFYARHYISSAFSTGLWSLSQSTDTSLLDTECVKLDGWYNDFNPGLELLSEKRVKKAFRVFRHCFAATKDIIKPQDPRIVIYIVQQAIRFVFYDHLGRNLSATLLKYATALCRELFSMQHPLYIILSQMARMDPFEFAQNIRAMMDCYFDHLEPFLDTKSEAYGFTNDLRGLTVSLMEATHMIGIYEAKPILEKLIRRVDEAGHSSLHLKNEMAAAMQRNRFFFEARDMLLKMRNSRESQRNPYEFVYSGILLMVTLRRMKDQEAAVRVGYEVVDYLVKAPRTANNDSEFNNQLFQSNRHSSLMLALSRLESDLRDMGRNEEAEGLRARLDVALVNQYGVEDVTDEQVVNEAATTPTE